MPLFYVKVYLLLPVEIFSHSSLWKIKCFSNFVIFIAAFLMSLLCYFTKSLFHPRIQLTFLYTTPWTPLFSLIQPCSFVFLMFLLLPFAFPSSYVLHAFVRVFEMPQCALNVFILISSCSCFSDTFILHTYIFSLVFSFFLFDIFCRVRKVGALLSCIIGIIDLSPMQWWHATRLNKFLFWKVASLPISRSPSLFSLNNSYNT